jgi:hypothetical protein
MFIGFNELMVVFLPRKEQNLGRSRLRALSHGLVVNHRNVNYWFIISRS